MKKILAILSSFSLCVAPSSAAVLSCSDGSKNLSDIDFSELSKIHFQNNVMATVNYINGEIQKIISKTKKEAVINLDFTTNVAQVVNHSPSPDVDAFTIKITAVEGSKLLKGSKEFKMEIPPVTFRKANFDLVNSSSYSVTYMRHYNGVNYLGTAENGLFYSIDNTNYHRVQGIPEKSKIQDINMINSVIYVSTDDSFYTSNVDGTTFEKYDFQANGSTLNPTGKPSIFFIKEVGPKHYIYIYCTWGLYYSKNNAASFNWISTVTTNNVKVDLFESGPNIVMINRQNVFYSSDGTTFSTGFTGSDSLIYGALAYDNSILLRTSKQGLQISANNGASFQSYTTTDFSSTIDIRCMSYIHGSIFLGSKDKGFWIRRPGDDNFTRLSAIESTSSVYHIAEVKEKLYIGTSVGLYTSDDNGTTVTRNASIKDDGAGIDDSNVVSSVFASEANGIIFVGTSNNGLWYSYSDETTFIKSTTIPADATVVAVIQKGDSIYAYVYKDKKYRLYTSNW